MATYVLANGVQAIVYIDVNHNVDQIFYQSNQWQFNDLTAYNNSPAAASGSPLATYVLQNGVQAVAYIDVSSISISCSISKVRGSSTTLRRW